MVLEVHLSKSVIFFFPTTGVSDASALCRRSEKKKKNHRRTLESGMSDTDTMPKIVCPCNLGNKTHPTTLQGFP